MLSGKSIQGETNDEPLDDGRFVQALTHCQRELRAFVFGMAPTKSEAEDVLQEVNLALWKKRHLYDWQQDFLRWAFGFANMEIRSFRSRSAKKSLWLNSAALDSIAEEYIRDPEIVEQRRDALSCCMEKLGPTEHQFITDFYKKQHSAQELADATGRSLRNVYKILTRARRALRECVERTVAQQSRTM